MPIVGQKVKHSLILWLMEVDYNISQLCFGADERCYSTYMLKVLKCLLQTKQRKRRGPDGNCVASFLNQGVDIVTL